MDSPISGKFSLSDAPIMRLGVTAKIAADAVLHDLMLAIFIVALCMLLFLHSIRNSLIWVLDNLKIEGEIVALKIEGSFQKTRLIPANTIFEPSK